MSAEFVPQYSPWRHGGWYVDNVSYPSGAVGCVAWDYDDKGRRTGRYRIACDTRRSDLWPYGPITFHTRDAAARAERMLTEELKRPYTEEFESWWASDKVDLSNSQTLRDCAAPIHTIALAAFRLGLRQSRP